MSDQEMEEGQKVQASLDNFSDSSDDDTDLEDEVDGTGLDAKKIVLLVLLPLFIIGGVGVGLYLTGTFDKMFSKEEVVHQDSGSKGSSKTASVGSTHFLEIPNMIVNLNTPDGQPRYLRLSVQLELQSAEDLASVEALMPRVVDQFQTYLRELRIRDLRGSQGIYRLQMELLARVNAAAYPIEVKDVLFQEILIQ